MPKTRNSTIDALRGVAVFCMILIHTNAYYLSGKLAYHLWNWSQFAVPVFVFCSAYLYFKKSRDEGTVQTQFSVSYFTKRIKRLLIPYYWYLVFYFLLLFITKSKDLSFLNILRHLTLTTPSNDLSWLVLLFTCFIFLIPLLDYLGAKKYFIFLLIVGASYLSNIYFLFFPSPVNFKLIMWLPWLIICIQVWYIAHYEDRKNFFHSLIFYTTGVFVTVLVYKILSHQSLSFYSNKYPPNIYYLSFGLFSTALLYRFLQKITLPEVVSKCLAFLSKYSYSIFFIHTLVIFYVMGFGYKRSFNWVGLFIFVMITTVVLQMIVTWIQVISSQRYTRDQRSAD